MCKYEPQCPVASDNTSETTLVMCQCLSYLVHDVAYFIRRKRDIHVLCMHDSDLTNRHIAPARRSVPDPAKSGAVPTILHNRAGMAPYSFTLQYVHKTAHFYCGKSHIKCLHTIVDANLPFASNGTDLTHRVILKVKA